MKPLSKHINNVLLKSSKKDHQEIIERAKSAKEEIDKLKKKKSIKQHLLMKTLDT